MQTVDESTPKVMIDTFESLQMDHVSYKIKVVPIFVYNVIRVQTGDESTPKVMIDTFESLQTDTLKTTTQKYF